MPVTIQEISSYAAIEEIRPAWLELRQALGDSCVCNHPDWIRATQFLPSAGTPLILAAFEGDALIGLAPMCIKEDRYRGIPLRRIRFISDSPVNRFLVGERPEEVVRALLLRLCAEGRERAWDLLEMGRMGGDEACLGAIRDTIQDLRLQPYEAEDYPNGIILIDDWATYLQRKSRKFREDVRRRAKRLNKLGSVSVLRYSGLEDRYDDPASLKKLERVFKDAIQCARHSWQGSTTEGTSISDEEAYRFFSGIIHTFASMNMLLFHVLYVEGVPIAFDLSFMEGQTILAYKIGYDQEYSRCGPGGHLYRVLLEYASEKGIPCVDQMSIEKGQEYKLRWVDELRGTRQIKVFNKTAKGSLARLVMQGLTPMAKRLLRRGSA
jgi:CelD/BcsL family acetyltransferase involved in cellulose biosynthesis